MPLNYSFIFSHTWNKKTVKEKTLYSNNSAWGIFNHIPNGQFNHIYMNNVFLQSIL